MEFRIADTFSDSLARLTGEEQKAAKLTAFDLQQDPTSPGLALHKLDHARDKNFWSVRVGSDLRLIVHRTSGSLLLCYVDHHDRAYDWAQRRKIETHPTTGAAQLVEIRETVREITIPIYVPTQVVPQKKPGIPASVTDAQLLSYGVPPDWLKAVREADENSILDVAGHLPAEASEAVLQLATGGKPPVAQPAAPTADPFDHPDAQRRFRVMKDTEELARALDAPWDKWTVFLHPEQRQWVERDYAGPTRVAGSAGTGKTIVALHRAVYLARANPNARVLLTTFSETLANALRTRLRRLVSNEPKLAERIEVHAIDEIGVRLYKLRLGPPKIASREDVRAALESASADVSGHKFGLRFLTDEWEQIVDAWQVDTWERYRDVPRLGRKTRLSEAQRKVLWSIFGRAQATLAGRSLLTKAGLFTKLAASMAGLRNLAFDFAVVDEAQDLSIANLRFLAAMAGQRPNALFFAGDLGQRIFQVPFSWLALGVDVRGRSRTLRVNYRTSHQIRQQADRLLSPELTDVDGNAEDRRNTVSVFNGPKPAVKVVERVEDEVDFVARWITERIADHVAPHEIGVFVRSNAELPRARAAAENAGLAHRVLDEHVETVTGQTSISTMHLAKGLEFRAVAVMACDEDVIPSRERIESVGDQADLQDVFDTERQLLYVACTRARDHLLVTAVKPASEFLGDFSG